MKKSWIKRALSLTAALALLLSAAGLAEMPLEAEASDDFISADAVDAAVESDELDLGDDADEPVPVASDDALPDLAPEDAVPSSDATDDTASIPGDEAAPDAPEAAEGQLDLNTAEDAASPSAPEAAAEKQDSAAPVEDAADGSEAGATEDSAEESDVKTTEDAADDSEVKATEDAAEGAEAKATEDAEAKATENIAEGSEAKPAEGSEGEAVPEAEKAPEDAPAQAPALEASETGESAPAAETDPAPEAAPATEAAAYEAAPSALTFAAAKIYMGNGEYAPLTVLSADTGAPVEATLTSSKPAIVRVEGAGVLHARKKGVVKITATASNGVTATCIVKVVKAPSKIRLTPKKLVMGTEETRALKAKLTKGSASAITWVSDNPAVVAVDAAGNLTGVAPGTARVTASTFNKKKASCAVTVLGGKTPTTLTFPSASVSMGVKEKVQLQPVLGAGEAALFTYSSSKKGVVSVSKSGLMTAKKKGTAMITVKTHNGLKFRLTVKVVKAPGKVTLSKSKLSLQAGQSATLTATLPAKTASAIAWSSSDANVASVDAAGNVTALNPGKATITAATFNGKKATCTVTVTAPPTSDELAKRTPPALSAAQMAANIRAATSLGSKRNALGNIAELLMNNGFECSFAAGVCANVYSEGSYGFFESSKYIKNYQKRPRYFCFLDGGDYYTKDANGNYVITDVYLSPEEYAAYTGPATKHLRFGDEKFYWNYFSGKYVWEVDLNFLQAFMDLLTDAKLLNGESDGWNDGKGWHGKFGLGCTQWTGGRTRKLVKLYRQYAGEGNPTITKEQVIAAEHDMILYDLQGDYKKVYTGWRSENENGLYCPEAANSAGSWVCLKYEIPANKEESAVKRGKKAAEIYNIMVGAA